MSKISPIFGIRVMCMCTCEYMKCHVPVSFFQCICVTHLTWLQLLPPLAPQGQKGLSQRPDRAHWPNSDPPHLHPHSQCAAPSHHLLPTCPCHRPICVSTEVKERSPFSKVAGVPPHRYIILLSHKRKSVHAPSGATQCPPEGLVVDERQGYRIGASLLNFQQ